MITAADGGIINDPVLLRLGENHFWLALADSDVRLWAAGVALRAGLRVEITGARRLTAPDPGPQGEGPVVQALFGDRVTQLRYYYFLETALDGIPVVVTRTGWSAEVGYEVYLRDGSRGDELWERIMAAGKPFNMRPTGPSDIRRIEAGILNWGADITLEDNVYQVGLERLVDESKPGDYIGRQALERIKAEGVGRKLAGVEIAGDPIEFNTTKWAVTAGGRTVGQITSAIHSPRLKKNIGYAMVPAAKAIAGTALQVRVPGVGARRATVVPKPFIDPGKEIPKG